MLNRWSVNSLLKTVIGLLAATVVVLLSIGSWNTSQRFATASRIATIVDASGFLFEAMHNLRLDRSFTVRWLNAPAPAASAVKDQIRHPREMELPALKSAAEILPRIEFADRAALVGDLHRSLPTLSTLHTETWPALDKPKTERRAGVADEFYSQATALLDTLDKLTTALTRVTKGIDSLVDKMMQIKEVGWTTRNGAADLSVLVSNGLASGQIAPDALLKYAGLFSQSETAWAALQDVAFGADLPASVTGAIAAGKNQMFEPEFLKLRERLMKQQLAGEKPEMTSVEWSTQSVIHLDSMVDLARAALGAARDHAWAERSAAARELSVQLVLVLVALGVAIASMLAVSRRVIGPLQRIQDAMLKVAAGDLTPDASFAGRTDEIRALAGAFR